MQPVFFATGQQLPSGLSDGERRDELALWMTSSDDRWFAKAFVNRMWSELVGHGFCEPVDDMGPDRQPLAPQAFEALASDFIASHYDVKWLMRTIIATTAYQRESRPRHDADKPALAASCLAATAGRSVVQRHLRRAGDRRGGDQSRRRAQRQDDAGRARPVLRRPARIGEQDLRLRSQCPAGRGRRLDPASAVDDERGRVEPRHQRQSARFDAGAACCASSPTTSRSCSNCTCAAWHASRSPARWRPARSIWPRSTIARPASRTFSGRWSTRPSSCTANRKARGHADAISTSDRGLDRSRRSDPPPRFSAAACPPRPSPPARWQSARCAGPGSRRSCAGRARPASCCGCKADPASSKPSAPSRAIPTAARPKPSPPPSPGIQISRELSPAGQSGRTTWRSSAR